MSVTADFFVAPSHNNRVRLNMFTLTMEAVMLMTVGSFQLWQMKVFDVHWCASYSIKKEITIFFNLHNLEWLYWVAN